MGIRRHLSRPRRTERTLLEIQVHPSEIRRGVWYIFLTRRQLVLGAAAAALALLFLLVGLLLTPTVTRGLLSRKEYRSLVAERSRQGERLNTLVGQLESLGGHTDEMHLKMDRIYLAYGLESDLSVGQGGYPIEAEPTSESIYSAVIRQGRTLEAGIQEQLGVLGTFVQEVQAFEEDHSDQVHTTPSVSPLRGGSFVLTSPFGTRRSPFTKQVDTHSGIDLAAPTGTPIYAPADGVVVFAGRYPLRYSVSWWRYGNLVALRNGNRFISLFGHCDEVKVRSGQKIRQGDEIATVGNSGWSTSPHLHYEVRLRDDEGAYQPVDPRIYILDHRWRDEEELLVRARQAPRHEGFDPLPRLIRRQ